MANSVSKYKSHNFCQITEIAQISFIIRMVKLHSRDTSYLSIFLDVIDKISVAKLFNEANLLIFLSFPIAQYMRVRHAQSMHRERERIFIITDELQKDESIINRPCGRSRKNCELDLANVWRDSPASVT